MLTNQDGSQPRSHICVYKLSSLGKHFFPDRRAESTGQTLLFALAWLLPTWDALVWG